MVEVSKLTSNFKKYTLNDGTTKMLEPAFNEGQELEKWARDKDGKLVWIDQSRPEPTRKEWLDDDWIDHPDTQFDKICESCEHFFRVGQKERKEIFCKDCIEKERFFWHKKESKN